MVYASRAATHGLPPEPQSNYDMCCHHAVTIWDRPMEGRVAMPQEVQHICANGKGGSGFDEFLQIHRPQLEASNVPQRYWKTLYNKLENEVRHINMLLGDNR